MWVELVQFRVEGDPLPKERPRCSGKRVFTPDKTLAAEQRVAWAFRQAARSHEPDKALYWVDAEFYRRTHVACDIDNLLKLVLDGINKICFADDKQVTKLSAVKGYDPDNPRTIVRIYRWEEQ